MTWRPRDLSIDHTQIEIKQLGPQAISSLIALDDVDFGISPVRGPNVGAAVCDMFLNEKIELMGMVC